MIAVRHTEELRNSLPPNVEIGFVPTMGALHDGHMALVRASKERGLFTVASIFVNPTQFNDQQDFEKYPTDLEGDMTKLASADCDLVFIPDRDEVYGKRMDNPAYVHSFGHLEDRYEGAFRPGHFRGVGQVVHILFELVQPDVAFFGKKDFQQLQVIRALVEMANMNIEIVGVETVREDNGLAMSSRNLRLDSTGREVSTLIYASLVKAKEKLPNESLTAIREEIATAFATTEGIELEYFDIIDPVTFQPKETRAGGANHAVIAAHAGSVRLIDNMELD